MRIVQIVTSIVALLLLAAGAAPEPASRSTAPQSPDDAGLNVLLQRSSDLQTLIDRYREEQANFRERQAAVREQIGRVTGQPGVTPELVRQDLGRLIEQQEQLELEGAGAKGRREGLEKAIAQLSHRLEDRVKSDGVAVELQKAVDAREQQVRLLEERYKVGAVTQSDVLTAQAGLAQAKADLAAARQRAAGAGAVEALDAWDRELLRLSVDDQERQARLQYIAERLKKLGPALADAVELDRTSERLVQADRLLHDAENERDKLEIRIQSLKAKAGTR